MTGCNTSGLTRSHPVRGSSCDHSQGHLVHRSACGARNHFSSTEAHRSTRRKRPRANEADRRAGEHCNSPGKLARRNDEPGRQGDQEPTEPCRSDCRKEEDEEGTFRKMRTHEVKCPRCSAPAGVRCHTASGRTTHWARVRKAQLKSKLRIVP